jgi:hypothetical protein
MLRYGRRPPRGIGSTVTVGDGRRPLRIVGKALFPNDEIAVSAR